MVPWVNDEEPVASAKPEVRGIDELESLHQKYDKKPLVSRGGMTCSSLWPSH